MRDDSRFAKMTRGQIFDHIAALEAENARLNSENEILIRTLALGMDAGGAAAAALAPAPAPEPAGAMLSSARTIVAEEINIPPDSATVLTRCAAHRDGDCYHPQCPQTRDGEPAKTGRHCPIDNWHDDD